MQTLRECTDDLNWQKAMELWQNEVPEDAGEEWHIVSRSLGSVVTIMNTQAGTVVEKLCAG